MAEYQTDPIDIYAPHNYDLSLSKEAPASHLPGIKDRPFDKIMAAITRATVIDHWKSWT